MVLSPIHVVVDCGGLSAPMDGAVELTGTQFGDKASYYCNPGFILKGDSSRECQASGEWSGAEPVCERKEDSIIILITYPMEPLLMDTPEIRTLLY